MYLIFGKRVLSWQSFLGTGAFSSLIAALLNFVSVFGSAIVINVLLFSLMLLVLLTLFL